MKEMTETRKEILPELDNWKMHRDLNGVDAPEVMVYRIYDHAENKPATGDFILCHENGTQEYGTFTISVVHGEDISRALGRAPANMIREMPSYKESLADLVKFAPGKAGELFQRALYDIEENEAWQDNYDFGNDLFRMITGAVAGSPDEREQAEFDFEELFGLDEEEG